MPLVSQTLGGVDTKISNTPESLGCQARTAPACSFSASGGHRPFTFIPYMIIINTPKSNSIYAAYKNVKNAVKTSGTLPVPFHIRNAPTGLMKDLGYGKGYKYAHDYKGAYTSQEYLPEKLKGRRFYFPSDRGYEKKLKIK